MGASSDAAVKRDQSGRGYVSLADSSPTRVKTMLHAPDRRNRMDARDQIEATFHVPAFVGYMGETCRR